MDRPTKISVKIIDEDNYEIVCTDEMSGSQTGINVPFNGYKALAEHFRTGAMEISSDELGNCNKPHVSGSALPDHGICMDKGCNKPATKDYNGHGHWVCDYHYKTLNDYFDEEYR